MHAMQASELTRSHLPSQRTRATETEMASDKNHGCGQVYCTASGATETSFEPMWLHCAMDPLAALVISWGLCAEGE